MKNWHYISILIGIIGILSIAGSYYQWHILYNDRSQMLFGVILGVFLLFFSYIYNWMRNKDNELDRQAKQLDAIGALITGNKIEALVEEAQGYSEGGKNGSKTTE